LSRATNRLTSRAHQSAKVELAINHVKTAKVLRLDVPPILLAHADEVIEYRLHFPALHGSGSGSAP
jgi:hypothetical protein